MTAKTIAVMDGWIEEWAAFAMEQGNLASTPSLVCHTVDVPNADFERIVRLLDRTQMEPQFLWCHQGTRHTLFGSGQVASVRGAGDNRFAALSAGMAVQQKRICANLPESVHWMGGAAFASAKRANPWQAWPDAWFVLPRFLFEIRAGKATLTIAAEWAQGQSLDHVKEDIHSDWNALNSAAVPVGHRRQLAGDVFVHGSQMPGWMAAVARTAGEIRSGRFDKVVLARSEEIQLADPFSAAETVAALAEAYPDAYVFAIRHAGTCFLGATPERLVKVAEGSILVDCLAGTTARGDTVSEDDALGQALLDSAKNREEHAVVYRWIRKRLEGVVADWDAPGAPRLKRLKNVQHLHTPIRGQLTQGGTALDAAIRLHPTPAVAGVPREAAMEVIRRRERMDRGWYAGFVGWQSLSGDGEFSVALRCGLVAGKTARLYAGCGIMGDSIPEQEWQETRLKMRPMETALGLRRGGETR